jgi:Domain of unknown function (DUF4926)
MTLRELDTVVLLRDLPEHGLRRGDVGAIVTALTSARFTVEFVRVSGHPHALVDLDAADLRVMDGTDIPAVRGTGLEG